jgi:hypothetical protein
MRNEESQVALRTGKTTGGKHLAAYLDSVLTPLDLDYLLKSTPTNMAGAFKKMIVTSCIVKELAYFSASTELSPFCNIYGFHVTLYPMYYNFLKQDMEK